MAGYLGHALESTKLTEDLIKLISATFDGSSQVVDLTEFINEAIETTCGIRTSMQGYLSTAFILNAMRLSEAVHKLLGNSRAAEL